MYRMLCGHCGTGFDGPFSQFKHVHYEGKKTYCSKLCRYANAPKPPLHGKPRPVINGICEQCQKPFSSKTAKFFCSLRCYLASNRCKVNYLKNAAEGSRRAAVLSRARGRELRACVNCESSFEVIKSSRKKFCTRICMRRWLEKRFDRWIASPQGIALPQNYDEFLSAEILPCLIEECSWSGANLSVHMNLAHGVTAAELKRAAGFNLSSGIISAPLQETLSRRQKVGVAIVPTPTKSKGIHNGYQSLEGREHSAKARALALGVVPRPIRLCIGCGTQFEQSTPFGRAKYCSIKCRRQHASYAA